MTEKLRKNRDVDIIEYEDMAIQEEADREYEIMGYMDEYNMTYEEADAFYEVEHLEEDIWQ